MRRACLLLASMVCVLTVPSPTWANTYTVVIDSTKSWSQARSAALLAGGYLATITSAAEESTVVAAIAAAVPPRVGGFWINLRETSECCYVWDNGETTCYSKFYVPAGEPNDGADGPGGLAEDRGQIIWNTDPARKGFWNDVPAAGFSGTNDISRLGYVIETGPPDPAGPCGACVTVSPSSFCNTPPAGATTVWTRISGVSTGAEATQGVRAANPGTISRTIIDISEPPSQSGRRRPARAQATYVVTLPVEGAGVTAHMVAAAFLDSINRQVGWAGFVANYVNATEDTLIQMYRPTVSFSSTDDNTVPGIMLVSFPPPPTGGVPISTWPARVLLALVLAGLASRVLRARKGPAT